MTDGFWFRTSWNFNICNAIFLLLPYPVVSPTSVGFENVDLITQSFIHGFQITHEHQAVGGGRALFYAEEEEVEDREVNRDVELFQSACSDIQRTIMEIKTLKESKDKNAVRKL